MSVADLEIGLHRRDEGAYEDELEATARGARG